MDSFADRKIPFKFSAPGEEPSDDKETPTEDKGENYESGDAAEGEAATFASAINAGDNAAIAESFRRMMAACK